MLKSFHHFADRYALPISLAIVFAYFLYFFLPAARSSHSFGRGHTHGEIDSTLGQLVTELSMALPVLAIILLFGWSRSARLSSPIRGRGLWWFVLPLLYTLGLTFIAVVMATQVPEGALPSVASILSLLTMVALIGLFEELLFRGILMRGLESRLGTVAALVISSVAFGLMHYVNWVAGQPFGDTTAQVFHAMGAGFLFGSLMLITGSIWPSVLLHALWDGGVSLVATVRSALPTDIVVQTSAAEGPGGILGLLFTGFEPLYGFLVLLVWLVHRRQSSLSPTT